MNSKSIKIGGGLLAGLLAPCMVHACACGCGIFDVGGSAMLPDGPGGMAWLEYDYMNQNRDFGGSSKSSPDLNPDKQLQSQFSMIGAEYMFNNQWGVEGQIPYTFRYFKGTDGNGNLSTHSWSGVGDIRINAVYTGFSDDLSTGITMGLKLPTGGFHEDEFLVDRDTQIGTGSTDILLGGFHRGKIGRKTHLEWFVQAVLDMPLLTQEQYRPGTEFDSSLGLDYTGFSVGSVGIIPVAQLLFSERASDSEANADSDNTGYTRVYFSPGVEFHLHPIKIYADAEIPLYQNFTGNQLAAPILFKFSVSYMF